jgi:hypothetical protein
MQEKDAGSSVKSEDLAEKKEIATEATVKKSESTATEKSETPKPKEQEEKVIIEDDDLCETTLRREKNKTYTLLKHGVPSECRIKQDRKLEFIDVKTGNQVKKANEDGLVLDEYNYLPCNSICSHFHCNKNGDDIFITMTCGNSESGYCIPKDKVEVISSIPIVEGDANLTKRLKENQKTNNLRTLK